jgi:hypothetical protein
VIEGKEMPQDEDVWGSEDKTPHIIDFHIR